MHKPAHTYAVYAAAGSYLLLHDLPKRRGARVMATDLDLLWNFRCTLLDLIISSSELCTGVIIELIIRQFESEGKPKNSRVILKVLFSRAKGRDKKRASLTRSH